jgi:hypothetical protein
MVAGQKRWLAVQRHAGITLMALGHPATGVAGQGGRKTAPVDEHQHLLARFEGLPDRLDGARQQATSARLMAEIGQLQASGGMAAGPLGQRQVPVDPL